MDFGERGVQFVLKNNYRFSTIIRRERLIHYKSLITSNKVTNPSIGDLNVNICIL